MADQQDHRFRRLEELEDENRILRENLARYKALEEDMLSQKVYEKARRSLIGWLSGGGVAIFSLDTWDLMLFQIELWTWSLPKL